MNSANAVVVYDARKGGLLEGEILSGNAIQVAVAEGVVLLPLEIDLIRRSGISGWAKRSYGRGWRYESIAGARGCPLVLHASMKYPVIEWVARLQMDEGVDRANVTGSLRFATDTSQIGAMPVGIAPETSAVQLAHLGDADEEGGWTLRGRGRMALTGDVMLALQLYGQVGGARVTWFAASQSR